MTKICMVVNPKKRNEKESEPGFRPGRTRNIPKANKANNTPSTNKACAMFPGNILVPTNTKCNTNTSTKAIENCLKKEVFMLIFIHFCDLLDDDVQATSYTEKR